MLEFVPGPVIGDCRRVVCDRDNEDLSVEFNGELRSREALVRHYRREVAACRGTAGGEFAGVD